MNYPIIIIPFKVSLPDIESIEEKFLNEESLRFLYEYDKTHKKLDYQFLSEPRDPGKFIWASWQPDTDSPMAIIGLILIFYLIPFAILFNAVTNFQYYIEHRKEVKKYEQAMIQYKNLLPSLKEHNDTVRKNESERQNALHNHLKKNRSKIKKRANKSQIEIFEKELQNQVAKVTNPTFDVNGTQHGISENFFKEILCRHFDTNNYSIYIDSKLGPYFPDFALKHRRGIFIDIEIDEPYVGHSKEVIHYYDHDSNYYSDQYRNDYFKENNWIVVRFTEKQVIESADSCCFEIAKLLHEIFKIDIPTSLKNKGELITEKLWSNDKANEMALFDYRNSYIPDEIKRNFW
jgi:very-short-patch-repair endonuclease